MINSDIQNQVNQIAKNITIGELDPFVNPTENTPPVGINVVGDVQSLLAQADDYLKAQDAAKPVTTPAVINNKVVKKVTAQVIGDDRIFVPHNIVAYEIDRIHKYFDYVETDDELRVVFTPENAKWKRPGYSLGHVLMCAHDATKKYLANMLGIGLDSADATWYKEHPLTESQGLPEAHTLTVLSDLVQPYGIGISHVYVKKGCSAYEEHLLWQSALGINPEAMVDRNKSNAEFIAGLELEGDALEFMKKQAKTWNFEYVDHIPTPCIAMSGAMSPVGAASGGGHTTYYGPREKVSNFKMGLKYDRLENIKYLADIPSCNTTATTEVPQLELDFYSCLSNNGKPIGTCATTGSLYGYAGNSGQSGPSYQGRPNGWSNPQTAREFEGGPEPSNVLRIQEPKKRNQNLPNANRRKERGATGVVKANNYSRFTPQEKAKFAGFSWEYAGCSPEDLKPCELQANYEITNQACNIILESYYSQKVSEMFQMCGADNWQDMSTDTNLGAKFNTARANCIAEIDPLITQLTMVDLYLMLKASKGDSFRSFMQSILNYIIYEEPIVADSELEQYFKDQGVDPNTGNFTSTVRERLEHMMDSGELRTDPVMAYDEVLQQYVEDRVNRPPIHNARLQALLMEQSESNKESKPIDSKSWMFVDG